LQAATPHTKNRKRRLGISLGIKHINRTPTAMPFAWCHCPMPDCRHSGSLLVRLITKKDRPNLEHRNISFATVLIAGRQPTRDLARPMGA
jgi:hypothetical protein